MELLAERRVPTERFEFKAAQARRLMPFLPWIFIAVALVVPALIVSGAARGSAVDEVGMAVLWTPLFGAFGLAAWSLARAQRRPTNWLLGVAPEGVYVKLRSYLNWSIEGDAPCVVLLAWLEIAGVRSELGRLTLELAPGVDHAPIAAALAAERERKAPRRCGVGNTWHHYPVLVLEGPPRLHLVWDSPYDRIRPALGFVKEALGARLAASTGASRSP